MKPSSRKKTLALVQGEGQRKSGPILGVDVHKSLLAYCILSETRILQEGTFPNTKSGVNELLALNRHYSVRSTAMEATAQYHFPLMFALQEAELPFLVANPLQTRETQGKKTDKLDARRIALAHRDGRLKPSVISPQAILHLRKIIEPSSVCSKTRPGASNGCNRPFTSTIAIPPGYSKDSCAPTGR